VGLIREDASGKCDLANAYDDEQLGYGIEQEVDTALDFMREFASDAQTPFFLFVSTRIPHVPWNVTRYYFDQVPATAVPLPGSFRADPRGENEPSTLEYNGYDMAYFRGTAEEMREALRCYYALALKVDEQAGRLLDSLRRLGLEEDTLFIFCSDHGEMGGAHNLVGKGFHFCDEVMRVPLILRWPGQIRAGGVCDRMVGYEDIMPTLCDIADVAVPEGRRGRSLVPLLGNDDAAASWREWMLLEHYGAVFPNLALALKSRDWLYVFEPGGHDQLFDRSKDPGETNDLAGLPEYAQSLDVVRMRLLTVLEEMRYPQAYEVATLMSHKYAMFSDGLAKTLRNLRLGYLER
jgi:arylsulfatase A-like enzyme